MGKSNKQKVSTLLDCVRKMPPLRLTQPDGSFSIKDSEMAKWIIDQPDMLSYVVNRVKSTGLIVYDEDTCKWHGADYDGD